MSGNFPSKLWALNQYLFRSLSSVENTANLRCGIDIFDFD